jgi:Smg protein
MSERWLLLLNALTQSLVDDPGFLDDPGELLEELVADGYQLNEVEIAMAWLSKFLAEPLSDAPPANEEIHSTGLRAQSLEEQLSFSPEAFGYLLRLENSGLIDPSLREEILERALMSFESEIGEDEMKTVSRMVLMDHGVPVPDSLPDPLELLGKTRTRHLH